LNFLFPSHEHVRTVTSIEDALALVQSVDVCPPIENVFIIGGAVLYEAALRLSIVTTMYITRVHNTFPCDVHVPALVKPAEFRLVAKHVMNVASHRASSHASH
jgi:dihydrofolate reductase